MSDRTVNESVQVQQWIEERRGIHSAATDGPWYKTPNDRILSESVQWPEGDDYDVAGGLGRQGAVVEAIHDFDGNAIVDAHNMLPRALNALEAVIELHKAVFDIHDPDARAYCNECGRRPCATIQAIEGAIEGEGHD